jgi:3'-phosphoadenosine 5'-phosphosulfate sulfotransferase (PAPS reductase)/FAD synthetase
MKNYLSFGGGVNSVALYLHMMEQGVKFEALFVDHETDWPETYEYVKMFRQHYPVTVLKPKQNGYKSLNNIVFDSLYDFCWAKKMFPSRQARWCTTDFKRAPLNRYQPKKCFVLIGFDWGERHRAKIYSDKGREYRYPLIEAEIGRDECKRIIKRHDLPVPPKSGCYICPFQRVGQLRQLRRKHPDLFCKLEQLENRNNQWRVTYGTSNKWPWVMDPYYSFGKPVRKVAEKGIEQRPLFAEDEFPPCECWL